MLKSKLVPVVVGLVLVPACSSQSRNRVAGSPTLAVETSTRCEPVGCRKDEFLIARGLGLFTPYEKEGRVLVELPFRPELGDWFGLVDDGQFFSGQGTAEVVGRGEQVEGRFVARLALDPVGAKPFSIMGPLDEASGRTREVAFLPERLFDTRARGNPTVVLAASSEQHHVREVSLRCECDQMQQQSWYWQEEGWCLTRSRTQNIALARESSWCGEAPIPNELLVVAGRVDAAFCPPTKDSAYTACSLDEWLATGAGNSLELEGVQFAVELGSSPASRF